MRSMSVHQFRSGLIEAVDEVGPGLGDGKTEPFRHALSGLWSRRLSLKDRLIYRFDAERIYALAIGGPYDQ